MYSTDPFQVFDILIGNYKSNPFSDMGVRGKTFDPERYNMIDGELVERDDFKKKQKEKEVVAARFLSEKEADELSKMKEDKEAAIAVWDKKINFQTKVFESAVKTMKDKEAELDAME